MISSIQSTHSLKNMVLFPCDEFSMMFWTRGFQQVDLNIKLYTIGKTMIKSLTLGTMLEEGLRRNTEGTLGDHVPSQCYVDVNRQKKCVSLTHGTENVIKCSMKHFSIIVKCDN